MDILKVRVDNLTAERALKKALALAKTAAKSSIFYLNLDCLCKAQKDPEYRKILNEAPLVVPDGIGLTVASRMAGKPLKETWAVTDFFRVLIARLGKLGYKLFFIGCQEGVAERAAQNLKKDIPELNVVGTESGFFKKEDRVIDKINRSGAEVVIAAMGSPLQEKWIARNRERLKPRLFVGVGALFNWLSGRQSRAPGWMRRNHLEWFWRVLLEPRRMFRRYFVEGLHLLSSLFVSRFRRSKSAA